MVKRAFDAGAAQNLAARAAFTDRSLWERAAVAANELSHDELVQGWSEIAVASLAYHHLLKRLPNSAELRHHIGRMKAGAPWAAAWREVATAPERDQKFGHFAPASMSPAEARELYQLAAERSGEQCVGGIGPRCDGVAALASVAPRWSGHFTLPDGTRMGYVEMGVGPSGILHDNACLDAPPGQGVICGGYSLIEDWGKVAGQPAAMEWNKAVWNVLDKRFWRAKFGPYPVDAGARSTWYDDLRPVPARSSMMAPVLGPLTTPVAFVPYAGRERKVTSVLSAPAWTWLDHSDVAFCASKQFSVATAFMPANLPVLRLQSPAGMCK